MKLGIGRSRLGAVSLVATCVLGCSGGSDDVAADTEADSYVDPGSFGPHPVGVMTRVFVDEERDELISVDDPDDKRTLVTEIWYPAAPSVAEQEKDGWLNFLGDDGDSLIPLLGAALGTPEEAIENLRTLKTRSVREAQIADGSFPVILFSHGNSGFRFQSIFLCEHLASHGYIVISADHTYNAGVTQLPSGLVLYDSRSLAFIDSRVQDMSFLLDTLEELNEDDAEGRFTGRVDLDHVGITGHSFGGTTSLLASVEDDRIDAVAPMTSGGATELLPSSFEDPMLHFLATEDQTVDNDAIEDHYARSADARWLIRVRDAGHFSFSNMCLVQPQNGDGCGSGTRLDGGDEFTFLDDDVVFDITNFYEAAFFGYFVKGVDAYEADLLATPFSEHTTIDRDGFPR